MSNYEKATSKCSVEEQEQLQARIAEVAAENVSLKKQMLAMGSRPTIDRWHRVRDYFLLEKLCEQEAQLGVLRMKEQISDLSLRCRSMEKCNESLMESRGYLGLILERIEEGDFSKISDKLQRWIQIIDLEVMFPELEALICNAQESRWVSAIKTAIAGLDRRIANCEETISSLLKKKEEEETELNAYKYNVMANWTTETKKRAKLYELIARSRSYDERVRYLLAVKGMCSIPTKGKCSMSELMEEYGVD